MREPKAVRRSVDDGQLRRRDQFGHTVRCGFHRGEPIGAAVIPYVNRLSDALFVMSRHAARLYGEPEPLWEPEKT